MLLRGTAPRHDRHIGSGGGRHDLLTGFNTARQPHGLSNGERAHHAAVDPDLGRPLAGSVALPEPETVSVARTILTKAATEFRFEHSLDGLTAHDAAAGTAAPDNERAGERSLTKLGIESNGPVHLGFTKAQVLGDDRHRLARNPTELFLHEMQCGQQLAVFTRQRLDEAGDALDETYSLRDNTWWLGSAPALV